jgi:hypothetical protein
VDRQCPSCGGFCKKSGCERENIKPEDVWQKAMENALVYGTGFVRFDSMGGISVVDPKDYHYLEKKEWVGLTADEIWKCNKAEPGSAVDFHICVAHQNVLDFAEALEAKLKEKNCDS